MMLIMLVNDDEDKENTELNLYMKDYDPNLTNRLLATYIKSQNSFPKRKWCKEIRKLWH